MTDIVIIAGGLGTRLAGRKGRIPKTLLPIGDRTILDIIIVTMDCVLNGRFHLIIAAGVFFDDLSEYVREKWGEKDIQVVKARQWREGNAATVLAAEELVGGKEFIVQMSDHLFSQETYSGCVDGRGARVPFVCAQPASDGIPPYLDLDDATKILCADDGRIQAIGKGIGSWNAIDMGVFRMPVDIFDTIRSLPPNEKSLSGCVRFRMAADGFFVSMQPGAVWKDIDSAADLAWAVELAKGGTWVTNGCS